VTGERSWNRSAKRVEKLMGDLKAIKEHWLSFQSKCNVDELMDVSYIHDLPVLVDSYRLMKEAVSGI
jgi:hypothetical protein